MKTLFALAGIFLLAAGSPIAAARADEPSVEQQVAEAVKAPGVSIVHFWAPWCPNCKAELQNGGWAGFIEKNPKVHFYFVTVWNNGDAGHAALSAAGIGRQPNITVLADSNLSRDKATKTKQWLGLPLSWIPTTWLFKDGQLRYALNYGEVRFSMLEQMVADSQSEWEHK